MVAWWWLIVAFVIGYTVSHSEIDGNIDKAFKDMYRSDPDFAIKVSEWFREYNLKTGKNDKTY